MKTEVNSEKNIFFLIFISLHSSNMDGIETRSYKQYLMVSD